MESLSALLRRHGIRLNKSLGQHFLDDETALRSIAHALAPTSKSTIIEIGAGVGNLTYLLAQSGAHVLALELDPRFQQVHHEIFETSTAFHGRVQFCYMDALEFDYTQASQQTALQGRDLRITGNIPYQITSPLIMRILESGAEFTRMVLMMQREVAQRLNAKPNTRRNGGITIKVQYFCRVQEVMEVPARSFIPPPKVDSTVLAFERKPESISHADRKCFFELIDGAFGQRRKMLPNSISAADIGYSREQVQSALESLGLRKDARAENLGLDEFLGLFHILNR